MPDRKNRIDDCDGRRYDSVEVMLCGFPGENGAFCPVRLFGLDIALSRRK